MGYNFFVQGFAAHQEDARVFQCLKGNALSVIVKMGHMVILHQPKSVDGQFAIEQINKGIVI